MKKAKIGGGRPHREQAACAARAAWRGSHSAWRGDLRGDPSAAVIVSSKCIRMAFFLPLSEHRHALSSEESCQSGARHAHVDKRYQCGEK